MRHLLLTIVLVGASGLVLAGCQLTRQSAVTETAPDNQVEMEQADDTGIGQYARPADSEPSGASDSTETNDVLEEIDASLDDSDPAQFSGNSLDAELNQ